MLEYEPCRETEGLPELLADSLLFRLLRLLDEPNTLLKNPFFSSGGFVPYLCMLPGGVAVEPVPELGGCWRLFMLLARTKSPA